MHFLADDLLKNTSPYSPLFNCPKYKIVFDLDANLKFPFKDYYLPHEKFWVEHTTEYNISTGFYIEEAEDKESFVAAWHMNTISGPKKIFAFDVTPVEQDGRLLAKVHTNDENKKLLKDIGANIENLMSTVMQLIYELNRRDAVRSDVKGRKVEINGNKRDRRKFQYSVITRRKYVSKAIKRLGRKLEFTFAFPVRGHWRDLPGKIGKDRKGNYCVEGKTWVKESVKGEGKPFNKRIIK